MENESQKGAKDVAQDILNKSRHEDSNRKIKQGRITLMVIGILNLLVAIYYFTQEYMESVAYIQMAIGLVFVGLYFLGAKKPMLALVLGLVFFVVPHLLTAVLDPSSIYRGIIFKVIIIVFLVKGIISVNQLPKAVEVDEDLLDDEML